MRPNAHRLRQLYVIHFSTLDMEEWIFALQEKDELTDSHSQSVMWISKMLETMSNEFKMYHYEIVAGLEASKEAALA